MKFILNFFCCSLAVAVAAGGLLHDHDLNEYRLASKRYHRKIRSSKEATEFPFSGIQQNFVRQTDQLPILHSAELTNSAVAPNTSFLLDLPYPSHFLVSLQMLNLSLPFIETGISIPEDPPTPEFDLDQVITNGQYQSPREENQSDTPVSLVDQADGSGGRRRAINRIRHRIPVRRLPKRSADVPSTAPIGKPVKFRNWNASNPSSVQRRQEFTNKLRSTTTQRPTFIKKFQAKQFNRRTNTTKLEYIPKRPSRPSSEYYESDTESLPVSGLEQSGAFTEQRESSHFNRPNASETSDRFAFHSTDHPSKKSQIGGFRPIQPNRPPLSPNRLGPSIGSDRFTSLNSREKFINGHSGEFHPIVPAIRDVTTSATTEIGAIHYDFPPPSRLRVITSSTTSNPITKLGQSKYISQFHSSSSLKAPSEEITQIQKPEIDTISNEAIRGKAASGSSDELIIFATSTTNTPLTEFVPNLKFPSFEFPSIDGSSTPSTLPPPLPIEELIKKFTGKDFIADSSSVGSTPNPPRHPSPIQPKSSTTTTVQSTISIPELESLDDLEASLKKLLVVTTSSAPIHNNNKSFIPLDAPIGQSHPHSSTTSSPSTSTQSGSSFVQLPVIPPPSANPVTEETLFSQQETSIETTTTKETLFPSESEISKSTPHPSNVVNSSSLLENSNQPVSVQRGPLDVSSSFDGSFSPGVGQHQSEFNFQPSGFPQQQQHQFQSNNFGGFSGGNFGANSGGGDVISGQQNPYYYGAGLFTGSGGQQGQFSNFQNGFDGTLHYSPTGPPVGESNAITQGLSLLASFGGSGGGHQQFAFQPSSSYQQPAGGYQQAFNEFVHPASLQASSQIQSTSSLPSQGFSSYPQGYPSFNLVQQQPQSYTQSQLPYQFSQQPQHFPTQQQQQQLYAPAQQQSYQLVGANSASALYPVQVIQFQPQGVAYQSQQSPVSTPTSSDNSNQHGTSISPSQFGTLLSSSPSVDSSSITAGSSASGTGITPTDKDKSIDAASSQLVNIHVKPVLHSIFADQEADTSQIVQLISVGPETDKFSSAINSLKTGAKKSLYNRGLQSGYYP